MWKMWKTGGHNEKPRSNLVESRALQRISIKALQRYYVN